MISGGIFSANTFGALGGAGGGGGGGGLTVGDAITGGTGNRVLYETSGNLLGESANLTFNGTFLGATSLSVGAASTAPNFEMQVFGGAGNATAQWTTTATGNLSTNGGLIEIDSNQDFVVSQLSATKDLVFATDAGAWRGKFTPSGRLTLRGGLDTPNITMTAASPASINMSTGSDWAMQISGVNKLYGSTGYVQMGLSVHLISDDSTTPVSTLGRNGTAGTLFPFKAAYIGSTGVLIGLNSGSGAGVTPNYLLDLRGVGSTAYAQFSNTATGSAVSNGLTIGVNAAGQRQLNAFGVGAIIQVRMDDDGAGNLDDMHKLAATTDGAGGPYPFYDTTTSIQSNYFGARGTKGFRVRDQSASSIGSGSLPYSTVLGDLTFFNTVSSAGDYAAFGAVQRTSDGFLSRTPPKWGFFGSGGVMIGSPFDALFTFASTNAPNYALDIRATAAATAVYSQYSIVTTTGNASTDGLIIGLHTDGTARIRQQENLGMEFYTNNVLNVSLAASGALTIGPGAVGVTHRLNTNTTTANADALTLLNGPTGTAGNPDTYLTININGTDHVIPAWIP